MTTNDPLDDPALRRRLRACSVPGRDVFVLLAADHRQNLLKKLDPAIGQDEREEILRTLKVDLARDAAPHATGYLTDPVYGFAPCIASADVTPDLPIIVALEKTGYLGESWERMPDLVDGFDASEAVRQGATAAKLLVYFHPDAANADEKETLVRDVAEQCRANSLPLFLEPLVHSPDPDRTVDPGTDAFEDAVVGTAERLSRTGPAVMKVEFPGGGLDARDRWDGACRRLDDACAVPWVLLGAGVSHEEFEQQVEVACAAGASGVLVGRTIWAEALHMDAAERSQFLTTTAARRLADLTSIIAEHGRPWTSRH